MGEAKRRALAGRGGAPYARGATGRGGSRVILPSRRQGEFGSEGFAFWVETAKRDTARDIFRRHGEKAFDSTPSAAAIHEAGHCVVGASLGEIIASVEIYPAISDRRRWGGITRYARGNIFAFPGASAQDDLMSAARQIAGFVAEQEFDEDFCEGSSLKERAIFGFIVGHLAQRFDVSPEQLGERVMECVADVLKKHRTIHHEIAQCLMTRKALHRDELARLLEPVERMDIARMMNERE